MKHVLIVEDDLKVHNLAVQALGKEYRVSTIDSADGALKFMTEYKPDLILMSAKILEMDDLGLMDMLRNISGMRGIPVIFIIPQGDTQTEERVHKLGAADVITKPFIKETLLKRVNTQLELEGYRDNTLEFIGAQEAISVSIAELVECRDITTGGHLKNTTVYFKLLLQEVLNHEEYKDLIPTENVMDLLRAAPLHDIGKIGISDDILRKASTLNYDEFEYMKTHTILGKETFEKIMKETGETRFLKLARDLAYCHHERWDGSGYPSGLKGDEIPLYARILTIADVYDALTSRRTYKEAYSHPEAVKIIREGKGSIFDPDLVEIFLNIQKQFEQALKSKSRLHQ